MTEKKTTYYLEQVRNELVKFGVKKEMAERASFCKVDKNITEENRQLLFEGFKRLLFVEIRLERGKDNAQKIFESLNSTGLDLSQADLIRNYIQI